MIRRLYRLGCVLCLFFLLGYLFVSSPFLVPAIAQSSLGAANPLPQPSITPQPLPSNLPFPRPYPVMLDGETVFNFFGDIPGIPVAPRVKRVIKNLENVAKDYSLSPDDIRLFSVEGVRIIGTETDAIVSFINADAKAANLPLDKLAQDRLQDIRNAIIQYRERRKPSRLLWGTIEAIAVTIVVLLIFRFLGFLFPQIYQAINQRREILFRPLHIQRWQILSAEQEAGIFFTGLRVFRWAIILSILYFYIPLVLSFFPLTERLAKKVLASFYQAINTVWSAFVGYLPNLFVLLLVVFLAYYTVRLCRPFFKALENQTIHLRGFYPEWAQPTYKLVVFLVIAMAAAIIFPYLPGFDSPAFQGISLLIGALVTVGGASTIANLLGGYIMIYTRAFQLGDRISVDSYTGIVIEKTILSTRICTPNNEIVTIPNSSIVASSIINYSASLRDIQKPLVLHTTVTLGYDLPWRKVHETLINAALATQDILEEPAPCVWQTSLDDFYVSYELRASTAQAIRIKEIYAELHQNIQDKCNEVGIEIMSPHYTALRDGNQSTMPENYLESDYQAPGFRVQPLNSIINNILPQPKGDRSPHQPLDS